MTVSTRLFAVLRMIGRLWSDLPLLARLLKAWQEGRYPGLSFRTMLAVSAALVYVASPVDLLPDFVPGLGLIDDAAVLVWLLHSLAKELEAFRDWEYHRAGM